MVEEALDRLQSGDFGVCLSCEEAIAPKRLSAIPWARYCVTCQELTGADEDWAGKAGQARKPAPV